MNSVQESLQPRRRRWSFIVYLAAGLVLFGWLLNTPPGLFGKADAIGYAVCHRIDLRSFHLDARQLPLCARCSGMYLGAVLGMVYQSFVGRRRSGAPPWGVIGVLVALVGFFGVDGLNSYLHLFPSAPGLYEPQNWSRLLTGTGMGLAMSAAVFPAFNQTVWADYDARPVLTGWRSLGVLLALGLGLDLLVLTENPAVLYPLALISSAGVLIILITIYTMVWVMILRKENRYQSFRQLGLPLAGGLLLALAQIAALDWVRFLLTGTWDGFHIG